MSDAECKNGKCDLKNQTTDKALNFMKSKSSDHKGFGLFLFKDRKEERGFRKDITKDITYNEALKMSEDFGEECVVVKFCPYGLRPDLDKDVEKMVNGPVQSQLANL